MPLEEISRIQQSEFNPEMQQEQVANKPSGSTNPDIILSAIVPQFMKTVPTKSDGGLRPKSEVVADLEKKRDRLRDKLRAGFEVNKVISKMMSKSEIDR